MIIAKVFSKKVFSRKSTLRDDKISRKVLAFKLKVWWTAFRFYPPRRGGDNSAIFMGNKIVAWKYFTS